MIFSFMQKKTSHYRGVCWYKNSKKWVATITYDGKQHNLGYFEDEEEAARAYDKEARAQRGDNAKLNFAAEGERHLKAKKAAEEERTRAAKAAEKEEKKAEKKAAALKKKAATKAAKKPSCFTGVYPTGCAVYPWKATIRINNRDQHIGKFETEVQAARAYDNVAKQYPGLRRKRKLNFSHE
jgi:hypothetical protein